MGSPIVGSNQVASCLWWRIQWRVYPPVVLQAEIVTHSKRSFIRSLTN